MNFRIDRQLKEINGMFTFFDFFPIGISYMGLARTHFLYIWLIFWVIGISWSMD